MFRFHIRELLLEKERREGRRIPLTEVAEACGISKQVLSNLGSPVRAGVTNSANLESVCRYFRCRLEDLVTFDPPLEQEGPCHVDELYPDRRG
ncbi:MAG: helix-turn-helix transcriptional regulator [Planctomycetaceae bacterium]|nr:helix-turn-helix transcriptional regulator [Planctomycetaceae bacterium]